MADFTITISNSLNLFGPAPTTKWGTNTPYTMTWGTSLWGEGTEDLQVAVEKLIDNSITPDSALYFSVEKLYSNDLSVTSETTSEGLSDGSGYQYVFTGGTTEAEDRVSSTYTAATSTTSTYSSQAAGSTVWS